LVRKGGKGENLTFKGYLIREYKMGGKPFEVLFRDKIAPSSKPSWVKGWGEKRKEKEKPRVAPTLQLLTKGDIKIALIYCRKQMGKNKKGGKVAKVLPPKREPLVRKKEGRGLFKTRATGGEGRRKRQEGERKGHNNRKLMQIYFSPFQGNSFYDHRGGI